MKSETIKGNISMSHREDAAALGMRGLAPVQIAKRLDITLYPVRTHLLVKVGEGSLRRSDILFRIPAQQPEQIRAGCPDGADSGVLGTFQCRAQSGA